MQQLALRIINDLKNGDKGTYENGTVFGKAAALALAHGYLTITATSPGHTTYKLSR